MTNGKDKAAEPGAEGVAAQATEGILGPNPFIGLRPQDVLETVGSIGGQALKQPMLVLEQQAGLARDLISVLSGNAEIAPSGGDKRSSILRGKTTRSTACLCKGIWRGAML